MGDLVEELRERRTEMYGSAEKVGETFGCKKQVIKKGAQCLRHTHEMEARERVELFSHHVLVEGNGRSETGRSCLGETREQDCGVLPHLYTMHLSVHDVFHSR